MREILFRGKRTDNGEWIEGYLVEKTIFSIFDTHLSFVIYKKPTNIYHEEYRGINPSTVGQYTGLTDKNGTKIFEGDIIQNTANGNFGIVRWYDEHAAFVIQGINDNKTYWLFDNDFSKVRIVGNIFDTPELLEVRNG